MMEKIRNMNFKIVTGPELINSANVFE